MQLQAMQDLLAQRQQAGLHRQLRVLEQVQGTQLWCDGKAYLNFSGNDYLGLASDPAVISALQQGAAAYGVGSTGSPLVTGQHKAHQALSDALSSWLNVPNILLFSSGFAANQAMLLGLTAATETLVLDKLSHASMIDAALQHPGGYQRFLHNDLSALDRVLTQLKTPAVVATEGVFSMDGDSPDLPGMLALCQQHDSTLLLDDAHGIGVLGGDGAGSLQHAQLPSTAVQCLMGNFGKALGGQGGFLATSALVADYLTQSARHFIYSTALSPALAVAMTSSVQLCRTQGWRREKLQENIALCRQLAAHYDLALLPSNTAIQPLLIGDSQRALAVSETLARQGIWLTAIRSPTVPVHQARLRITLSALHQPKDIAWLFQLLSQAL